MSMTDAIGRVAEIRTTLQQLSAVTPAAASAAAVPGSAAAASSTGGNSDFAAALAALTETPAAASAGSTGTAAATAAAALSGAASGNGAAAAGKVLDAVQQYLGLPYVWGGNDPAVGLDCSSFVQNVYKDLGYTLPRVTWDQMNSGTEVASMAQAQPGDLLISHDGGHVAIYLGNGKAVDAPQPGQTIQIRDAWETDANLTTIRRILPTETAGAASGFAPASAVTDVVAAARAAQAALTGAFS